MEDVVLVFGNEGFPQLDKVVGELAWAGQHDIVRVDVVVPQRWHDGHGGGGGGVVAVAEHLHHFVGHLLVEIRDLGRGPGDVDIVVVPRRVTCPNHKVDLLLRRQRFLLDDDDDEGGTVYVFKVFVDPPERLVDL